MTTEAIRAWQVLIACAWQRRTITYSQLAELVGAPGAARAMWSRLGEVAEFCQERDLPALTVLVVNSETGRPGEGYPGPEDVDAEREFVFGYPWFAAPLP